MNYKQQIEEMAKVIDKEQTRISNTTDGFQELMKYGVRYCHAKAFYKQGYRKIPEDSVVLTEEKYNELKGRAEQVFNEMDERMKAEIKIERKMGIVKVEQARKETAKAIFQKLETLYAYLDNEDEIFIGCWKEDLKDLAKQYGVEIEG